MPARSGLGPLPPQQRLGPLWNQRLRGVGQIDAAELLQTVRSSVDHLLHPAYHAPRLIPRMRAPPLTRRRIEPIHKGASDTNSHQARDQTSFAAIHTNRSFRDSRTTRQPYHSGIATLLPHYFPVACVFTVSEFFF